MHLAWTRSSTSTRVLRPLPRRVLSPGIEVPSIAGRYQPVRCIVHVMAAAAALRW